MRSLSKWISTIIRVIPVVNSLLLIYLFILFPSNFRLNDILEYGIETNVMELLYNIRSLSIILIISITMFIISCIEGLRLLLANKMFILIIEYVLVFLFFQELLFTFLYIVTSIISIKFIRFFINPSFNRKDLSEKTEGTYININMKIFIGFLMINIGSILVVSLLLSFIMELNAIAILSYILTTIVILIIKRRNIYRYMVMRCPYFIMFAIPPFGILSLLHS